MKYITRIDWKLLQSLSQKIKQTTFYLRPFKMKYQYLVLTIRSENFFGIRSLFSAKIFDNKKDSNYEVSVMKKMDFVEKFTKMYEYQTIKIKYNDEGIVNKVSDKRNAIQRKRIKKSKR